MSRACPLAARARVRFRRSRDRPYLRRSRSWRQINARTNRTAPPLVLFAPGQLTAADAAGRLAFAPGGGEGGRPDPLSFAVATDGTRRVPSESRPTARLAARALLNPGVSARN